MSLISAGSMSLDRTFKRVFALKQIYIATCMLCNMYFLHQIDSLYANLCEYFEANMKQMMRINGVCKYTETSEYEADKIHIVSKVANTAHPNPDPYSEKDPEPKFVNV
jgi:hypothetical protein